MAVSDFTDWNIGTNLKQTITVDCVLTIYLSDIHTSILVPATFGRPISSQACVYKPKADQLAFMESPEIPICGRLFINNILKIHINRS
jgi:hypothetical protein